MVNTEMLFIRLVAELKLSEFDKACVNAGLTEDEKKLIISLIEKEGE
jgi:hypothetical protein